MKNLGKNRSVKILLTLVLVVLLATAAVVCLTACGEIRYDYYVLTTATNSDGTLTITACTVVKDKDVVIPAEYKGKKIKALGDGSKQVFGGCEFSTLIIEPGVEEISDNACLNWSPLKTLSLGEGLKRIGANAFSGCTALKDITVPKTVTSIGEAAFENTAWYKEQPNGKIIYVGSFLYEFKGNMPSGTEIKAGDPIVGSDAQYNGVKYISDYAFSGCIGLKSIVFPQNLEKIGSYAFFGCTSLEEIAIPEKVDSVGAHAFSGCTLLSEVQIPSGIGAISDAMFYDCCGLSDVQIASGITAVGASAFENCVGLQQISLPDSVIKVGDKAFKNCVQLSKATANKAEEIGSDAFNNCIKLSDYTLASTIKTIGDNAFDNCVAIKQINLPEGVTSVGKSAFTNCVNLEKVTVNHKKTAQEGLSFGEDAFSNCFKIDAVYAQDIEAWCGITFSGDAANPLWLAGKLFIGESNVERLVVPEGVTSIGAHAFVNLALSQVTLPSTLKEIGESAFDGCIGIKQEGVYISDVAAWCGVAFADEKANPLYYGEKLFVGDAETKDLVIPETVSKISAYAFYNDESLVSVTIPASVTAIEKNVFTGCAHLEKIEVKLGEQPESWDGEWNDFCGTEVLDEKGANKGTEIKWTGKKEVKLDTNTIMAIVVGGILVVVAIVLLVMWGIRKIKKKIRAGKNPEQKEEKKEAEEVKTEEVEKKD